MRRRLLDSGKKPEIFQNLGIRQYAGDAGKKVIIVCSDLEFSYTHRLVELAAARGPCRRLKWLGAQG